MRHLLIPVSEIRAASNYRFDRLKVAGKGEKTRYLPLHPSTELIHD